MLKDDTFISVIVKMNKKCSKIDNFDKKINLIKRLKMLFLQVL